MVEGQVVQLYAENWKQERQILKGFLATSMIIPTMFWSATRGRASTAVFSVREQVGLARALREYNEDDVRAMPYIIESLEDKSLGGFNDEDPNIRIP